MKKLVYIYYFIMVVCFIASLFYLRFKRIKILALLLFISIFIEAGVEFIEAKDSNFFYLYHYFNIPEYALVTLLLREGIATVLIKKLMFYSIFIYTAFSIYTSLFVQSFQHFPAISHSLEGMLIILWCIIALWQIEPSYNITIFQHPGFWFAVSFLIYFSGTIAFDSIYNSLVKHEKKSAEKFFAIINSFCNYLLYILLLTGILCHRWGKKFIRQ